jgi:hypothetical protein
MTVSHYFQPESALTIGAAATDDARIAVDLATALAALGPTPAKPPKAAHVARFIRDAVRQWTLTENRMADALRITNAVPEAMQNHPAIVALRCRILRLMGDFAGTLSEIERQCARPNLSPDEVAGLNQFSERNGTNPVLSTRALAVLGLEPPNIGDPAAWFCDPTPRPNDMISPVEAKAAEIYCQLTGQTQTPVLQERLRVANTLIYRDRAMTQWHYAVHRAGDGVAGFNQHVDAIRDAVRVAHSTLIKTDLAPLHRAIADDRNIIVMRTHGGSGMVNLAFQDIAATRVFIARNGMSRPGFQVLTTGDAANIAVKMLKLAKAMKAGRHLVLLYPDGPSGLDFAQLDFAGYPMKVGMGAAALARVHQSTLFYAYSIWCGTHFELKLIEGAKISKGMDKVTVNAEFLDLYKRGVDAVLQSGPENLSLFNFPITQTSGSSGLEE